MNLVNLFYGVSHRAAGHGPVGWRVALLVYRLGKAVTAADIHPRAIIDPSVRIPHPTGVVIGETARIGLGSTVMPGVVIGSRRPMSGKRHADIGEHVFIGAGAKILGPVKVGDGATIGANAVVLEDVPEGATVVGIPGRVT